MVRAALLLALMTGTASAQSGTDCDVAEADFAVWLTERYGADAREAELFNGGESPERWGVAASIYIVVATDLLESATPESRDLAAGPFVAREGIHDHAPTASDLNLAAELLLLTGAAADCIRAPGTPMTIRDEDMGSQFDALFPPDWRAAIRSYAEEFL